MEDEGSGLGGYQANTQGEEVEGSGLGGYQANTQGVSRPTPRGDVSQHALRQTPQQMATAVGSMHSTEMHSCVYYSIARIFMIAWKTSRVDGNIVVVLS